MISLVDYAHAIKEASLDDSEPVYNELRVRDVMSEHPQMMSSESTIYEVAAELSKGFVHAVIIAENGMLKGIVTTADIIRYFLSGEKQSDMAA
jgi:predicted transcriptional regulator